MPVCGLKLKKGVTLGFHFIYAPYSTSSSVEWSGDWSSLTEIHRFYKSTLSENLY